MKNIQNIAAYIFIAALIILTGISMLGIWNFFSGDVINKSSETLGLLAIVAIIVMAAGRFIDSRTEAELAIPEAPDPAFKSIRRIVLVVLIIGVSILAIIGVLTIWDVFSDSSILYKSLGSAAIMAFSSFVIVLTCLDRENSPVLHKKRLNSPGPLIAILIVVAILFLLSRAFFQ
jgi:magnesium-transporting ATPase (P-type)